MDTGFGLGGCINKGGLEFFLWGSGVPSTPDGRYTSYDHSQSTGEAIFWPYSYSFLSCSNFLEAKRK